MIRLLYYGIPAVMMIIFILIMTSANYMKTPRGDYDNVPKYIQSVSEDVKSGKWDKAKEDAQKLDSAWRQVIPRVQFSAERDEITKLSTNIDRLKTIIEVEDKGGAMAELGEAMGHWEGIGK